MAAKRKSPKGKRASRSQNKQPTGAAKKSESAHRPAADEAADVATASREVVHTDDAERPGPPVAAQLEQELETTRDDMQSTIEEVESSNEEHKRADEALRREHALTEAILTAAPVIVLLLDPEGSILQFNPFMERLTGWALEEVRGRDWFDTFLPARDRDRIRSLFARAVGGERTQANVNSILTKDRRQIEIEWYDAPMRDAAGQLVGLLCAGQDITERRRAEEALREREQRLSQDLADMGRLQECSTKLVQSNELDPLLLEIVEAAIAVTRADMGDIQRLNRTSGVLQIVATRGFESPFIEFFNAVHEGEAPCGIALLKRERTVVEDVATSPVFAGTPALDPLLAAGVRAVISTPLVSRAGEIVGMLSVHYRTPRHPADRDLQFLDLLARQAADWIERMERMAAVRDREDRLRAILNTAADAIITIDEQGIIQSVNPAAERMFGYSGGEMDGQNVSILMPSSYREEHDGYLRRYLQTGEARIIGIGREVLAERKDGSIFPADLAVSQIDQMKLFTGIIRDITRYKDLEREVVDIASMQQYRIGEDLHDRVGQELTALNLLVGDLAETVRTDPKKAEDIIGRIAQGLRRSQQELRGALSGMIHTSIDAEGVTSALRELANRIQSEGKVVCTCDCPEHVTVTDNLTATHLYLIAQEAVHNSVKHAQAKEVRISLEKTDGGLILSVKDDGVGMPKSPTDHRGLGLRIMQNRAAILGAKLSIEPAEPSGTRVKCIWLGTNDK